MWERAKRNRPRGDSHRHSDTLTDRGLPCDGRADARTDPHTDTIADSHAGPDAAGSRVSHLDREHGAGWLSSATTRRRIDRRAA